MSSILTNMSAMSALQNLAVTQKSLAAVQNQISSGLAVATASDNAAYWSISTTMKSDTSALSAVKNALNLGSSVVSTATSAISSVTSILQQMKADLVTAQTAGADMIDPALQPNFPAHPIAAGFCPGTTITYLRHCRRMINLDLTETQQNRAHAYADDTALY